MDSYGFVDSIQVEKANALARYRRFNNIAKMFRLIEVFLAVVLISWSSTRLPTVFKVSGEYLYAFSSYVLNQHVVFLVGNVIVVVCYVLSGHGHDHTEVGNESAEPEIDNRSRSTDHFDMSEAVTDPDPVPVTPPVEELLEELPETKQQTVMEEIHEIHEKVVRYEDVNVKIESKLAAEMAIRKAAKQIERFQRTQSVRLRREIAMKSRRELRRSVTDRGRSVAASGDGDSSPSPPSPSSFETVERLSNEEFRIAVEAFISKQQSLLKQQSMVEE